MPRTAFGIALLLAFPAVATAHGLGVQAKLVGDVVRIEAFFDDDAPAAGATLTVGVEGGATVASGVADARGVWEFPRPAGGRYVVAVDAGDGHATKKVVTVPGASGAVAGGDSREEFTGPRRWLAAAAGVALIAAGTWLVTRRRGRLTAPPA
jgi:hypothetical protein